MSAFLGPIHYMMFNKIKIAAGRSKAVVEAFKGKHPDETDETVKAALPDGLTDFGDKPLDEFIGDAPIHSFLQGLIDDVEKAEAAVVTAFLYRFPDDAKEILLGAYHKHGMDTVKASTGDGNGSKGDFKTFERFMAEFYLEGMPCDPVSTYNEEADGALVVEHSDCLHIPKWESAGAPAAIMCELLDEWVTGCAEAVNPAIKLERKSSVAQGDSGCTCRLSL